MEQAIIKAIEGGFNYKPGSITLSRECIYLDPLFWQALGNTEDNRFIEENTKKGIFVSFDKWDWLYNWHRFIDHLAEGKDVDSFFNQLLHD